MVVSLMTRVTDDPGDRDCVHCNSSGICKMGSISLKLLILRWVLWFFFKVLLVYGYNNAFWSLFILSKTYRNLSFIFMRIRSRRWGSKSVTIFKCSLSQLDTDMSSLDTLNSHGMLTGLTLVCDLFFELSLFTLFSVCCCADYRQTRKLWDLLFTEGGQ